MVSASSNGNGTDGGKQQQQRACINSVGKQQLCRRRRLARTTPNCRTLACPGFEKFLGPPMNTYNA
jgi:hypothetical protein